MKCDLCERELTEVDLIKDSSLCEDCHKSVFDQNANQIKHIDKNTDTYKEEERVRLEANDNANTNNTDGQGKPKGVKAPHLTR